MENNIFEYLAEQTNAADAGYTLVILAFALSFILACLIVFTYQVSTPAAKQSTHFMQSLLLLALIAATIMQAIGDSIARGLGILGALAIIRFRTNIQDPRNITFTFASLAAGLACGMYGFVVAVVGTVGFCLSALLLRFSYFGREKQLEGILKFEAVHSTNIMDSVEKTLKRFCSSSEQIEMIHLNRKNLGLEFPGGVEPGKSMTYNILLKAGADSHTLSHALSEIEGINLVSLKFIRRKDEI